MVYENSNFHRALDNDDTIETSDLISLHYNKHGGKEELLKLFSVLHS